MPARGRNIILNGVKKMDQKLRTKCRALHMLLIFTWPADDKADRPSLAKESLYHFTAP